MPVPSKSLIEPPVRRRGASTAAGASIATAEPLLPYVSVTLVLRFALLLAVLAGGGGAAVTAAMIALCIWALIGPAQAIRALSLGVVIKYLNGAVFAFTGLEATLAWLLLFLAAVRVLPYIVERFVVALPVFIFSLPVAVLSITTSEWPEISIMKLLAFTLAAVTALTAFAALDPSEREAIRRWFFSLTVTIVAVSLPTIFFPAIAHARAASAGFQGILNHPQAFGIVLAPFAAWFFTGILFQPKGVRPWQWLAVAGLFVMILISGARTAMAAIMLSLFATFLIVLFIKPRQAIVARPLRAVLIAVALLGCVGLAVLASHGVAEALTRYIVKNDKDIGVEKSFQNSRGNGAELQWQNFLARPITGNGLGIYPGQMSREGVVTFLGIPISAPAEKGFLPTAILEETGLIGTGAFLIMLMLLANRAIKTSDIRWYSFFFASIFINVGEVVIFSVGGIGLYFWLLIGLATLPEDYNAASINPERPVPSTTPRPWVLYKRV